MLSGDSSKNVVVGVLFEEWPLSAKEIFNRVSKLSSKEISYQAIHKIILSLLDEGTISKIENKYLIDINWVKKNQLLFSSLEKMLSENNSFVQQSIFETVYEVDKFLVKLCSFLDLKEGEGMVLQWVHFWIPLFSENEIYKKLKDNIAKSNFYSITPNDSPIDEWCVDFWKKIGLKGRSGIDFGFDLSFLVYKDLIVQVFYPTEIKNKIDSVYKSTKDPLKLDINNFFNTIFEQKTRIPVLISKNKEVADELRDRIKSYF
jgi:hypothetical protein